MNTLGQDAKNHATAVGLNVDRITINGGKPLRGRIELKGAKNLVTKAMVAAILGDTPSVLKDVPNISDVRIVRGLLEVHGVSVTHGVDEGELIPDSLPGTEQSKLFSRAEVLAGRALTADSLKPEGHFAVAATVGRNALTKGKKERIRRAKIVREEALRTLALDPTHDGAYHVLGRWNAEIMRLSGLSRFFAKRFLGAGIFSQASWEKAIANLQKAVELDPQRIYHRLELARIYADRKRYQEARDQLGRISSLPDRELLDPLYRERALELQRKIGDRT